MAIDPFALAGVLGVHVSTIYRWESKRRREIKADPIQTELLARLDRKASGHPSTAESLGRTIVDGLVAGGTLRALHDLLAALLSPADD
jgi:hypothetical protein